MLPRLLCELPETPAFRRPDLARFKDRGGWTELSGAEVALAIRELGAALSAYGAGPGAAVAVYSRGGLEAVVGELASQACGAVAVPLDGTLSAPELAGVLEGTEARIALASDPDLLERVLAVRPELGSLELVFLFRRPDEGRPPGAALVEVVRRVGAELLAREPTRLADIARNLSPDGAGYLLTARREADRLRVVPVSHRTVLRAAAALSEALGLGPGDRVFIALPSEEGLAQAAAIASLLSGASICFGTGEKQTDPELAGSMATIALLDPAAVKGVQRGIEERLRRIRWPARAAIGIAMALRLRRVEKELSRDRFPGDLPFFWRLLDRALVRPLRSACLGRVDRLVSVGPPNDPATTAFLFSLGVVVLEGFGVAEAGGVLSMNRPGALRRGTVGRPLPGLELRTGPRGEIEISGPLLGACSAADGGREGGGGWVPIGWAGALDEGGFLRIVRRGSG